MSKEDEVFHRGTFKINKPEEWPKDIRLPADIQVKKRVDMKNKFHFSLKIKVKNQINSTLPLDSSSSKF